MTVPDRLLHHSTVVSIQGEDYPLKDKRREERLLLRAIGLSLGLGIIGIDPLQLTLDNTRTCYPHVVTHSVSAFVRLS